MKLVNKQYYPAEITGDHLEFMIEQQTRALLDLLPTKIEKGRWYTIRLSDCGSFLDDNDSPYGTITKIMQIEVEHVAEKRMVHVSSEEIHLSPSIDKPLSEKLKNCWRYLRDKTGGRMEERDVK